MVNHRAKVASPIGEEVMEPEGGEGSLAEDKASEAGSSRGSTPRPADQLPIVEVIIQEPTEIRDESTEKSEQEPTKEVCLLLLLNFYWCLALVK
ncbi:hypothetical protein DPMN_180190 [Dreissena polymorpha]|uniref:Uncharacterized protein n=1 Tax=Dreissena polymorpha TaxID=45954 RepID=A0A9D4EFU8_DREPO|nr:hypothetical protein DPMN_180190 [Dreissena polymorpha]